MHIDTFIETLSTINTPDEMSLNMYKGNSNGAIGRRENLRFYLGVMKEMNPTRLFIGEAPGRWGCFISGVPFTDEYRLVNDKFFNGHYSSIKELMELDQDIRPQREGSASVVWERLSKISVRQYPLMWNIYPFHPSNIESCYPFADDRENRKPNRKECELGLHILEMLLDCFNIQQMYAIGRTSEKILKKDFPNIKYICHPAARSGPNGFRNAFNAVYKIQ